MDENAPQRKGRRKNGTYEKGENNATLGHPRGKQLPVSPKLLYRVLLDNPTVRERLYVNLAKLAQTPKGALLLLESARDTLEGKPVQTQQLITKRTTIIRPAIEQSA